MDMWDRVSEQGIKLQHHNIGDQRCVCPDCRGGKSKEKSLSVTIKQDGIVWFCHRAKCGMKGGARDVRYTSDRLGKATGAYEKNTGIKSRRKRHGTIWA